MHKLLRAWYLLVRCPCLPLRMQLFSEPASFLIAPFRLLCSTSNALGSRRLHGNGVYARIPPEVLPELLRERNEVLQGALERCTAEGRALAASQDLIISRQSAAKLAETEEWQLCCLVSHGLTHT